MMRRRCHYNTGTCSNQNYTCTNTTTSTTGSTDVVQMSHTCTNNNNNNNNNNRIQYTTSFFNGGTVMSSLYDYLLNNVSSLLVSVFVLENKRLLLYKQRNNRRIRYTNNDSWHVITFLFIIVLSLSTVSFNSGTGRSTGSSMIIDAALFGPKSILSSRIPYFRGKQQQQQQQPKHHRATNTLSNRRTSLHPSTKTTTPKPTTAAYYTTKTSSSSTTRIYHSNDDNNENEEQLVVQDLENMVEIQQDDTNLESTPNILASTSTSESTMQVLPTSIQSLDVVQNRNQLLPVDKSLIMQQQEQSSSIPTSSSISISTPVVILLSSVSLLIIASSMAKIGIIPGDDYNTVYTINQILQDVTMTTITAILGYMFVKFNTTLVKYNILQPRDARKIIHTFSAPFFIMLWPFFTNTIGSRLFAVIVPTVNTIRLYLAAQTTTTTTTTTSSSSSTVATTSTSTSGINTDDEINITKQQQQQQQQQESNDDVDTDDELAIAISRSGDVKEALGGPFIYVIMMIMNVLLFWKISPIAIVSLCCMAAGDGLADIVGRRYGKYTMKWTLLDKTTKKTLAGTIAFFVASTLSSILLLLWLHYFHCISWSDQFIIQQSIDTASVVGSVASASSLDWINIFQRVTIISFITSILEVLPAKGFDDNYTVPIAAAILSLLLF